jgi:hypothetical protein
MKKGSLKKQTQFAGVAKWRKLLLERILWRYSALQGTKKQSQTKPIWVENTVSG